MPVTNQDAQAAYLRARQALDAVSKSGQASDKQKQAARRAREKLDLDFIGQNIADVEARTQKFVDFTNQMESLVESLSGDALLRGMRGLTEVLGLAKRMTEE